MERSVLSIDQKKVLSEISGAKLAPEVSSWLSKEAGYLSKLINVYVKDPDTFGLHPELRTNPILILKTILYSADTLYRYQNAYNEAIKGLAEVNGVNYESLSDIPEKLQELTVEREKLKLNDHLQVGDNIAIGLMGSGASGKGTIGKRAGIPRAVNITTRPVRPGEEHGKDYNYIRMMEPQVSETLDLDTGVADGVNYFEKYGPYVTTVHRPGRARHGTPISEFTKHYEDGEKVIFFEHGPIQVEEAARKLPELAPGSLVMPICVLPPKTGILPLASRIAVRTYGDPEHRDTSETEGYKIKDTYLESTIGMGQIDELAWTAKFVEGEKPLGVAYIVNDNLQEAVETLRSLVHTP